MANSPAEEIVKAVGGPGNIESLTHCATRLRFQLHDASGIDQAAVEAIPGVMGAVPQTGDRYQVIIGGAVQTVYQDINALPSMAGSGSGGDDEDDIATLKAKEREKGIRGKSAWLDSFFEFLSDSFRPILGALLGASLFITFMSLMSTLGVIGNWADPTTALPPSWQFVNLMWQGVFVFLPLMVAYNASKKLGADPWVGFAIMAVVMLPGFGALANDPTATTGVFLGSEITTIPIFGVPLTIFNYSSAVFSPLLMAAALGLLWKGLKKVIPENLQLIFVPFIAMLILIPLNAFLIGPIGVYMGAYLSNGLASINNFSPFIFAIAVPLVYPFMVPLGLHWPINAVMLLNIQTLGYDYIQGPMGAWNFACFGATAGVLVIAWRARDKAMKQTATGALAAGLLGGISEPSLYGIHLRFKRIYPRMLVGCFIGGLIIGLGGGVTTKGFVFTSLLTIPAFDPLWLYGIAVAAAFATSMTLVILSDYRTPEQKAEFEAKRDKAEAKAAVAKLGTAGGPVAAGVATGGMMTATQASATAILDRPAQIEVVSPLDGTVVPLSEVPDPVFAGGIMGPGAAILPTGDTVYAPGAGTIAAAQPTGHAFGLVLDGGLEILIHVGIDTVNLGGKGFDVKVKAGDRVEAGTPLVTFDRKIIEDAGYAIITPVIVLNADDFGEVSPVLEGNIKVGGSLISVSRKED